MISKTGEKIFWHLLILLAVGSLLTGCGKKAPPRPPGRESALPAVGGLRHAVTGETLSLTWAVADGRAVDPAGFYVYRSKTRLTDPDCPGCPILFERVAVVAFRGGAAPGPFEYRETLDSGYRYIYKVAAYLPGGLTGKDSDLVKFDR